MRYAGAAKGRSLAPDVAALETLGQLAASCPRDGSVVELGTFRGGSAAVLGTASGRPVWCFDTWAGIPAAGPVEKDGHKAQGLTGSMVADYDDTERFLRESGVTARMIRGDWTETLTPEVIADIGPISLLHIDGDWYESVIRPLRLLEPQVVRGGFIVLDDFAWWEGARHAFFDWCAETGIHPVVRSHTRHQLWWEKGREHYR